AEELHRDAEEGSRTEGGRGGRAAAGGYAVPRSRGGEGWRAPAGGCSRGCRSLAGSGGSRKRGRFPFPGSVVSLGTSHGPSLHEPTQLLSRDSGGSAGRRRCARAAAPDVPGGTEVAGGDEGVLSAAVCFQREWRRFSSKAAGGHA